MTETSGFITLVESSLPPRPTSITAYSTFLKLKNSNDSAKLISKNERLFSKIYFLFRLTNCII